MFKLYGFQNYWLNTWWRLFQKRVVCFKLDIYVFIQTMLLNCRFILFHSVEFDGLKKKKQTNFNEFEINQRNNKTIKKKENKNKEKFLIVPSILDHHYSLGIQIRRRCNTTIMYKESSEWLINVKWAIFQLHLYMYICISWRQHDEIMMMMSALHRTNTLSWIFIVLVHWNNSLQVDLSLQTDILFWFQGNQVDLSLQTDIHFVLFWFWVNQFLFLLLSVEC